MARGIDVEREVEVDRAAARLLGVQVDLPQLAERVRLDEVTLVVDVEPVVDGLALEVGDETRHVDDCHGGRLPSTLAQCADARPLSRLAVAPGSR